MNHSYSDANEIIDEIETRHGVIIVSGELVPFEDDGIEYDVPMDEEVF